MMNKFVLSNFACKGTTKNAHIQVVVHFFSVSDILSIGLYRMVSLPHRLIASSPIAYSLAEASYIRYRVIGKLGKAP